MSAATHPTDDRRAVDHGTLAAALAGCPCDPCVARLADEYDPEPVAS